MSRKVIVSPARAQEILEEVAARFDLSADTVRHAKRDYLARTARGEIAWRLKSDLNWSQRRTAEYLGCCKTTVHTLLHNRQRILGAFQDRVAQEHKLFLQSPEALELTELREKLRRLCGADLAEQLTEGLNVPKRCGIVLAMLAEAYPRALSIEAMCELYDDACARLQYGFKRGADRELIRKNVSDLNREMMAQGRAAPIELAPAVGGRRLTDEAAKTLSASYGVPRASRMLAAQERTQPYEMRMSA